MSSNDKRKQSIYLPLDTVSELRELGSAGERSMSWLLQRAWKLAGDKIRSEIMSAGPATDTER